MNGHECIECGYHGWAFDKDGVARYIPSADKDNITRSSMIQSYPVAEKVPLLTCHHILHNTCRICNHSWTPPSCKHVVAFLRQQ